MGSNNNLNNLVRKIMSNRRKQLSADELSEIFGPFFEKNPQFGAKSLESEVFRSFGFNLIHDTIALIYQWNRIAPSKQSIDPEPLIKPIKDDLNKQVDNFLHAIKQTKHLRNIFDTTWIEGLRADIAAHDGLAGFKTDRFTILIGFVQDEGQSKDFIVTIDNYFDALLKATPKKKSIRDKMQRLSKDISNYAGDIFELFILGPFAKHECIVEYEPIVGSNKNKAEALITLNGFRCLVEATISLISRPLEGAGGFDPKDFAYKMCQKLNDKMEQISWGGKLPILVFYNPHVGVFEEEIEMALEIFFSSNDAVNLIGIIVARDYRMRGLCFFKNPKSNVDLPPATWEKLAEIFPELTQTPVS